MADFKDYNILERKNAMNHKIRNISLVKYLTEKRWRMVVAIMSMIVAVMTLRMLLLRGNAMTKCGHEEHTHTEECYEEIENNVLICNLEALGIQEDAILHTHDESCLDAEGNLVCQIPERTGEEHTHTEECYDENQNLICGKTELKRHVHTEECYEKSIVRTRICGKEEHIHTEECYEKEQKVEEDVLWSDTVVPKVYFSPMSFVNADETVLKDGGEYVIDLTNKTAKLKGSVAWGTRSDIVIPADVLYQGENYAVTVVGAGSFQKGKHIKSITFVNPTQITAIEEKAFAGNTELFSVNNITNINQMQGLFSNAVIADDAFENTVIAKYGATKSHMEQQNPQGARGYETAYGESRVGIRANEQTGTWREDANGGRYELKTGQLFTLILYAEPKGENQNTEYRLYIETTASNAGLRMQPGQKMVVDGIEFTCHKTDVENVYYYSFQLENDRTVAVNMEYFYANGSTPGGGMRYWTTITERGVEEEHYIAPTEKPVETWWNTERQEYEIEKNASVGNLDIKTRDSYIWFNEAPAWRITVNRDEMIAGGTHGKDVVTQYIITDKITLPEGVSWNPAFIEAIKNKKLGMYYTTNRDMYRYMVEENGVKNMAFELVLQANHSLRNGYRSDILVDDENNVILRYIYQNSSSTKEVEPFTMDVSIQVPDTQKVKFTKDTAPFVFNIPEEAPEKLDIDNEVQLELQYNYSESKKLQAEDEISVNLPQGKLEISKRDTSDSKGNIAYSQYSKQVPYEITIYNNSSQSADVSQKEPGENWVVDVLHPGYIIRDTDMEKMFFEDAYGEHLVIEIANATFVTDMSAYRTVKNTDGEDTRLIPANENAEVVKRRSRFLEQETNMSSL